MFFVCTSLFLHIFSWGFREVQGVKAKLLRVGSDSWALPSGDGAIAEFSSSLYSHVGQLFFPFSFFSQCDSPGAPFEAQSLSFTRCVVLHSVLPAWSVRSWRITPWSTAFSMESSSQFATLLNTSVKQGVLMYTWIPALGRLWGSWECHLLLRARMTTASHHGKIEWCVTPYAKKESGNCKTPTEGIR